MHRTTNKKAPDLLRNRQSRIPLWLNQIQPKAINLLGNMIFFIGLLFLLGIPNIYAWDYRDLILVDHDLF